MAILPIELSAILNFDAREAINNMGRSAVSFKRLQSQANRVGNGLKSVSGGVGKAAIAFTPLTIGMGFAIAKANEFERGIYEVSTIADEAELPISKIDSTAINLAKTFATTPVEQTKALYNAVSFGASTAAEATDRLTQANKLAIGGVTETNTALELLSGAMNVYGGMGQKASDASDIFFTTVQKGKTTIAELSASFGQVMPTAAALDIGLADLSASLATVTLANINTAEASTALNAAFSNVIKPSKEAKDAAKSLGIEFTATALKSKGLIPFMQEITDKAGGNIDVMAALFGSVRGVKSMLALTANDGAIFNDVLKAMENRTGAADVAFQKMTKSTDFQMRRLLALKDIGMTVFGQVLQGSLLRMLSPLAGVAEGFVDIMQAVKTGDLEGLSPTMAAMAKGIREGFDTIRKGFDFVIDAASKARAWFSDTFGTDGTQKIAKFATVFLVVGAAIAPVILAVAGIGFVVAQLIPVISGLGLVFSGVFGALLGPIGLIGVALYLFWDQAVQVFNGILEVVGPVFDNIKSIVMDTFHEIGTIFSEISSLWGETAGSMSFDWKEFGRIVGSVIGGIITAVVQVVSFVAKAASYMTLAFVKFGTGLGEVAAMIVEFLMSPIQQTARGVVWLLEAIKVKVPKGLRDYAKIESKPVTQFTRERGLNGAVVTQDQVELEKALGVKFTTKRTGLGLSQAVQEAGAAQNEAVVTERAEREKSLGALSGVLDEVAAAANNTASSAESAAAAAKKKPCAQVNLDGREVARSNAKANDEIRARSGAKATPWQRRQVLEYGATPAI